VRPGIAQTARTRPAILRLVTAFVLAVFVFQGFLVQTHVHAPATGWDGGAHAGAPAQPGRHDPLDPANCPLCQEILHAGSFVAPGLIALPPAAARPIVFLICVVTALPPAAPARGWNSRAPPRA